MPTDRPPSRASGLKTDLSVPLADGVFNPLEISAPVRGRKTSKFRRAAFEQRSVP